MTTPTRHHWTHDCGKVRIIKCVSADFTTKNDFAWPESGPVEAPDWNPKPECGGGLHGWPWGFAIGDGKEPQYGDPWIVFEADPADVVSLDGKVKSRRGEVIYRGVFHGAWQLILPGHVAFVMAASAGEEKSTGDRGSAASTGDRGSAASTGYSGSAASTGYSGSAASTGDSGSAASTGYSGSAVSTGYSGSAASTGYSGSAASTGYRGSAASTGDRGIAAITGEYSTIEVGATGIAAVTADDFFWRVREGAVCIQRTEKGVFLLTPESVKAKAGDLVRIVHGERL